MRATRASDESDEGGGVAATLMTLPKLTGGVPFGQSPQIRQSYNNHNLHQRGAAHHGRLSGKKGILGLFFFLGWTVLVSFNFLLCEPFFFFCCKSILVRLRCRILRSTLTVFRNHSRYTTQMLDSWGYFQPSLSVLSLGFTHSPCGGLFLERALKACFLATLFGQAIPWEMKGLVIRSVRKLSNMLHNLGLAYHTLSTNEAGEI